MKKKFLLVLTLLIFSLSLTGCTTWLKNDKGAIVKESTTGQNLAENILCQPDNEDVIKTYKENNVKIKKLPKCSEFTPASGKYDGVWSSLFIKPLSWLIIQIGKFLSNYGLAIIVVTIIIRLIILPISKKSAMQSENMKLAQNDLAKLEKKYRNKQSQEQQMMKAQEMLGIYKKYDISPMSGCIFAFIQMPLFFAFLESLNRLPVVFEGNLFGFNLGTSPFNALFGGSFNFNHFVDSFSTGNIIYILLPIIVGLTTYFSFKLNSGLNTSMPEQEKQMKMMMNFMLIFIVFASFTMSTSIIIYWITGSLFTIIQSIILRRKKNESSKKRSKNKQ